MNTSHLEIYIVQTEINSKHYHIVLSFMNIHVEDVFIKNPLAVVLIVLCGYNLFDTDTLN